MKSVFFTLKKSSKHLKERLSKVTKSIAYNCNFMYFGHVLFILCDIVFDIRKKKNCRLRQ